MGRALWVQEEVEGLDGSSDDPSFDATKVNERLTPSSGEVSPREHGWNTAAFRRSFPDRWAEYLQATYRTAYAVQKAFPGIDSKTARDWISGKRDPSGSFVAVAVSRDPNAIKILGAAA